MREACVRKKIGEYSGTYGQSDLSGRVFCFFSRFGSAQCQAEFVGHWMVT